MNVIKTLLLFFYFKISWQFMPLRIENKILSALNIDNRLDRVSLSLTHEEIIKKGLTKSVIKYLNDQILFHKKRNKFNLSPDSDLSIDEIFSKFYGRSFCLIGLNSLLQEDFERNVALVDFDLRTKNLASAHFDSETLVESNQRVMFLKKRISALLNRKAYQTARELTGQVLHTIHDFYSHSNWVEMGNVNNINTLIGTKEFVIKQKLITPQDTNACSSNCKQVEVACDEFYSFFSAVFANNFKTPLLNCPFTYYKCDKNVILVNKLLTGYVDDSTLADGSLVVKPEKSMKCSHGGALDSSSFQSAEGGINKDSGFYMFSPHANLHLIAANLAINHTEYFFDQIREEIGDKEFSKFLRLDPYSELMNKMCDLVGINKSSKGKISLKKNNIFTKI